MIRPQFVLGQIEGFFIAHPNAPSRFPTLSLPKEESPMKKLASTLALLLISAISLTGCASNASSQPSAPTSPSNEKVISLGITQIVDHPSLNDIRTGIEAALKDKGYTDTRLKIDYQNAGGSMENAQVIAQKFEEDHKDLVIAITTPSAQAAFQTIHSAPVIFSAVTDPKGAGLEAKGITGISDKTPIAKQLKLLKALLPNAKQVAMVYNTSEQNSVVQVEEAKQIAPQYQLRIKAIGVSSSADLSSAIDESLIGSDVFYAHVDNTLASAFTLVIEKTKAKQMPIIGAVKKYVTDGALATDGINNYDIGYQTGLMAIRVLEGQPLDKMPIETLENTELIISKTTAESLHITIPSDYQTYVH